MARTNPRPTTVILLGAAFALSASASGSPALAASPQPGASTPEAAPDFLYQTRIDEGRGVYVSLGGQLRRVDADAPGPYHEHPSWTSDGSRVTFTAEGEWDAQGSIVRASEIWIVDADGANATRLATCDCWDMDNAAWSPDDGRVAYVEYEAPVAGGPPAASRIVVLDVATQHRSVVAESEPGQLVDIPRWSPDGSSLVVSIDRFGPTGDETGSSFGIVPAAGGGVLTPLLPFAEYAYAADWNRVTGALVYSVETQGYAFNDPAVSPWDLFEIQPDGSGRRTITDVGVERLSLPVWSSDGTRIAATLDTTPTEPGGQQAVVVDAASGAISPLADPISDYARLRPEA